MKLYELLNQCNPSTMKVHLATSNSEKINPLDRFKAGVFEQYQAVQNRKNFSREYILSLIQLDNKTEWLFAGIYKVIGEPTKKGEEYQYKTELTSQYASLIGRLVVRHIRKGRASYPFAENLSDSSVASVREEMLTTADFSSFHNTNLSRTELETIINHNAKDWKAALSSISAVYLLTDLNSNQLYVGSAYKQKYEGDGKHMQILFTVAISS